MPVCNYFELMEDVCQCMCLRLVENICRCMIVDAFEIYEIYKLSMKQCALIVLRKGQFSILSIKLVA